MGATPRGGGLRAVPEGAVAIRARPAGRKGREGAEQITDVIGRVFDPMLAVAYENGGSLLKFGGSVYSGP